ncbi:MAG: TetR family transcriptional regulator [Synergistaceae bacterium]|jgi:TetR/AcrR family acrAB operon transcriptional repressor|nr:TetR family transcriptional regulator [Synergistaceae bacterium]
MGRRTKEEALETKERLLEAALDVMSEKPFSSVSMREIAEKVGLSKGATYWHFKNKSDILVNLIEAICIFTGNEFLEHAHPGGDLCDVRSYFRNKMKRAALSERVKKINRLMQRRDEWPEDVRGRAVSIVTERATAERDLVEELLRRSQERGDIRKDVSARDLSSLITAIFHGLFIFQIHGLYDLDFSRFADFIFDAFENEVRNVYKYPIEEKECVEI